MALPLNPTTNFTSQDTQVYALMKFENLSGSHRIKWDWYKPNGEVYVSTHDYPLSATG